MTCARDTQSSMHRLMWTMYALATAMVAVITVVAFADRPGMIATPRGAAILALVAAYLAWDLYWRFNHDRLHDPVFWRRHALRLLAWGINFGISVALVNLHPTYVTLLWILTGVSFFYLHMPLGLLGTGAAIAAIVLSGVYGSRPEPPQTLEAWGALAIWLLIFGTWMAVAVMIDRLFRARNANEALIAELRASQEQLRAAAAGERELAALRERERIARDLHDSVGHALVLASVKLEAAERLGRVDRERAIAEVGATKHLLRETMAELRRAVGSLRAAPPERPALATLLRERAAAIAAETGLRADIACADIPNLGEAETEAFARVGQEALTNIVKHARASAFAVALAERAGVVTLAITDDGIGIPPAHDAEMAGHFGIRGMRERMELIGGRLTVAANPGGGTHVRAEVPLAGAALPEAREVTARGAA